MIINNKNLRYILILLLFGFIYVSVFEIIPKTISVFELGYTYASQINSLNTKETLTNSIKELEKSNRFLKNNTVANNGNNIYSKIKFLNNIADKNKIRIRNIIPRENIVENNLNNIPIDISFLTSYGACFTFLRDFESSREPVLVKGLKLINKEKSDLLEMTLTLNFYINEN
jgi:Tfp pilus assembly protein PilO